MIDPYYPDPEVLHRVTEANTYKIYRTRSHSVLLSTLRSAGLIEVETPEPWNHLVTLSPADITWLQLQLSVRIETDWSYIVTDPAPNETGNA